MTQIVNRRIIGQQALATLSDNVSITHDTVYSALTHKAFLFEYRARGFVSAAVFGEFMRSGGVQICLVNIALSDADLDTILAGTVISDESMDRDIPTRQQVYAIADLRWDQADLASPFTAIGWYELSFKPKSKGGIPFTEGAGWQLVIINRGGADLTTGSFVGASVIRERFAYEGGS